MAATRTKRWKSGFPARYFAESGGPLADELVEPLWGSTQERLDSEELKVAFEQYRLYVEMADRVSARRALANTFFLTLNTAIFTVIGVFWRDPPEASAWLAVAPLSVLSIQCFVWFWIIRSYRQLNSGKWAVVGAFEARLPASPWWRAEWKALGEGKDALRYWPISHVEQWVPIWFALAYVGGFVALVTSSR